MAARARSRRSSTLPLTREVSTTGTGAAESPAAGVSAGATAPGAEAANLGAAAVGAPGALLLPMNIYAPAATAATAIPAPTIKPNLLLGAAPPPPAEELSPCA